MTDNKIRAFSMISFEKILRLKKNPILIFLMMVTIYCFNN